MIRSTVGYKGWGYFSRGNEAQIMTAIFRILLWGLVIGNDVNDEEEERVYQSMGRYFMPIWANTILDTYLEADPLKFTRLYSKSFHNSYMAVREWLED